MKFTVFDDKSRAVLYTSADEYEGVSRITDTVCKDLALVADREFSHRTIEKLAELGPKTPIVIAGTVGHSSVLKELEDSGAIVLDGIRGKREVYMLALTNQVPGINAPVLVIAGSEKRGTIYGLFELSRAAGVSDLVYWCDVMPEKKSELILDDSINMISKEPSVKYRGFFINDEWPDFGNWVMEHFGGFTAKMYDEVFKLLLRFKGNYMWPAMWTSNFACEGPGLASAELADIYGVVMGTSHHEPCMRHSEEWDLVRGPESKYGNAWNYLKNKEGLIEYWRDAMEERKHLESIVTVGMRGERDSIMMENATLKDNIDILKDIITEQKKLIPDDKPKMLAVYKEVEEYFQGNETTEGLKTWEGLDDIILMLCEDNFGNLRLLPDENMRNREGGWGLYYHMDYHGGPISYEWINSSYLPKVWEQLEQAYTYGIRDIWIVNVGDIKTQEYPLSFFMDMAYDMDKYSPVGKSEINYGAEYTAAFVEKQFGCMKADDKAKIAKILLGYTKLMATRRSEAMNADTYHPFHERESEKILERVYKIQELVEDVKERVPEFLQNAYFELIYYPAMATTNIVELMTVAGLNKAYAKQGRVVANVLADMMDMCLERDAEYLKQLEALNNGKWYGMGRSEHIGFVFWNEEGCLMPVKHTVFPAHKPGLCVTADDSDFVTNGGPWTMAPVRLTGLEKYKVGRSILEIANRSMEETKISILAEGAEMPVICDMPEFVLKAGASASIELSLADDVAPGRHELMVNTDNCGKVKLFFELPERDYPEEAGGRYLVDQGRGALEAVHASRFVKTDAGEFKKLMGYGKTEGGIKAYPSDVIYVPGVNAPSAEFDIYADLPGSYELTAYLSPSNPASPECHINYSVKVNDGDLITVNSIHEGFRGGENSSPEWIAGVVAQIRKASCEVELNKGANTVTFYAQDPGLVLQRLEFRKTDLAKKNSNIGPAESAVI